MHSLRGPLVKCATISRLLAASDGNSLGGAEGRRKLGKGLGEPIGVVGSTGFIEIAVRDGNAAASLGLLRGARVVLHPSG